MPVDLDKIRALLASVAGFTPGPWRMSIENGSGIVAGHRHAVVSADSSALGWPVVLVERRSRPVMLAAPDLHRELTEAVGEIERLRAHNARMVALLSKIADAMDAADREPTWSDRMIVVTDSLPDAPDLRRLAAGEVDDG